MKRQRLGEENIATISDAKLRGLLRALDYGGNGAVRKLACAVRSKRKLKAAIVRCRRIKMDSGEDHPLHERDRRLDMPDSGFTRPVAEAAYFGALTNGDNPVLMPGKRPVSRFTLVKGHNTHRLCAGQKAPRQMIDGYDCCKNTGADGNANARLFSHRADTIKLGQLSCAERVAKPEAPGYVKIVRLLSDQAAPPKRIRIAGPQPTSVKKNVA